MKTVSLDTVIQLVGGILAIAVMWGTYKAKTDSISQEIKTIRDKIDTMHNEYVSYRIFDQMLAELKQNQARQDEEIKEMRDDVKQILKLLKKE